MRREEEVEPRHRSRGCGLGRFLNHRHGLPSPEERQEMSVLLAILVTELWACNNNAVQGLGRGQGGPLGHDEGLGQAGPSTGSGKEAVSAGCFFRFGSAGIKARITDSQERILEVI